jgi:peptidoglycan hydrolase CwlO-like protein
MNRVNQAIEENNTKITDVQNKISETTKVVNDLQNQISVIKNRIEKRSVILKGRAQSFQETGGDVSYLDVLLGSSSFGDLVERLNSVATLVQADNDLLKQHEADKQAVEEKQADVKQKLDDLNSMKTDLDGMQAQLADQKAQNDAMQAQFQQQEKDGNNKLASLMEQDKALAAAAIDAGVSEVQQKTSPAGTVTSAAGAAPSVAALGSGGIDTVIRAGYKYIGNSVYVFGGGRTASDVARGYFDCSGFVHWAFAQAGISVGSSTDSLKNAGRQVSSSQMQPGDLVFFNTYKTDGHVGIYIGGGKFIGSQSSTGVAIANMSSGYWAQHFNGRVVRIF